MRIDRLRHKYHARKERKFLESILKPYSVRSKIKYDRFGTPRIDAYDLLMSEEMGNYLKYATEREKRWRENDGIIGPGLVFTPGLPDAKKDPDESHHEKHQD